MELQPGESSPSPVVFPGPSSRKSNLRLRGYQLRLARILSVASILSTWAVFVAALPLRYAQLLDTFRNLSPAQELVLQELGVSGEQHARFLLFVEISVPILFFSVGLLIFWRKSDDWVAMLSAAGLTTFVVWASPPLDAMVAMQPAWRVAAVLPQVIGMGCLLVFFYVFPDGRFVPPWTRLVLASWGIWAAAWLVLPSSVFDFSDQYRLSLPSFIVLMAWTTTGLGAQVYRFMRVATPIQRQQTKLVLFGTTIGMLSYLVFGFNRFAYPILGQPLFANVVYDLVGVPIFLVTIVVVPIAFAISILRYRLWEIDVVINRALVYGALTAILAGLYTASIAFSQRAFVALTGERSDAAIVFTTLVVASAFTPVKARLQNVVDRYVKPIPHPMKEVQVLGDQMRSFIGMLDVEQLTARLCDEAARAFNASGGAVYLRRDGHFSLTHTTGEWTQMEGISVWLESGGTQYGWIALGPRNGGLEYSADDQRLLDEMAGLATRAIQLIWGGSFGPSGKVAGPPARSVGGKPPA